MNTPQLYPSHRYHPTEKSILVHNAADDAALPEAWRNTQYPEGPKPVPTCPNCTAMKAKFDEAWKAAQDEIASLKSDPAAAQQSADAPEPDAPEPAPKNSKKKKPAAAPDSTEPKPVEDPTS